MVHLSFALSITGTDRLRFRVRKIEEAERTVISHSLVHMCIWRIINCKCECGMVNKLLTDFYWKEQKQASIKRFLKEIYPIIGMGQCMNALHNMATLFNTHPYITSSGTPVGTKFTATYNVCRDGCWIMWPCYGVHITVCMACLVCVLCQPVHSCIDPSIHHS